MHAVVVAGLRLKSIVYASMHAVLMMVGNTQCQPAVLLQLEQSTLKYLPLNSPAACTYTITAMNGISGSQSHIRASYSKYRI